MLVKEIKIDKDEWLSVKEAIIHNYNNYIFQGYCLALKTYSFLNLQFKKTREVAFDFLKESNANSKMTIQITQIIFPDYTGKINRPTIGNFPLAKKDIKKIIIDDTIVTFDDMNYIIYCEKSENKNVTHNA